MAAPMTGRRSGRACAMSTTSSRMTGTGARGLHALAAELRRRSAGKAPADPEVVEYAARVSVQS